MGSEMCIRDSYSADVRENSGVELGANAKAEDIEANINAILDMSSNIGFLERE